MDVTLLCTGSPVPTAVRGGSSVLLSMDGEPVLVDCGAPAVQRMVEHGVDPGAVETLLFTHHHVDHNADFFQILLAGWSMGRRRLDVHGPAGTEDFVEACRDLYAEDIAYRQWFGLPADGIEDVSVSRVDPDRSVETDGWTVDALPVEHSIETYAYRFEDHATGRTCVVSGDTRRIDALADFAAGADLLIQDCTIAPAAAEIETPGFVADRFAEPLTDDHRAKHEQNHCGPEDAAWIAEEAGVETLVLTHLLPNRDHEELRSRVGAGFDGRVVVGEDGRRIAV